MRISQAYVEQNRQLHAAVPSYGAHGGRLVENVKQLMETQGCETLLDYGCGKGSLVRAVPGAQGYDPAVEEFSARPEPADLVTCTDVLEHVEPDMLEDVLNDIVNLTRKVAYILVACRPASKRLPDGRNAHLIIQPPEWWLEQLNEHFKFIAYDVQAGQLVVAGEPLRPISDFPVKSAVLASDRVTQMRSALERGLPELEIVPKHDRPMVLCAFGPSLRAHWQRAISTPGDVFTCSGAHDFLLEKGALPFAHCECDPRPHKAKFLTRPQKDVRYYIASCCHPTMLDQLAGFDVRLWHLDSADGEYVEVLREFAKRAGRADAFMLGGGSTIGLRAISVAWALGYRHFHVFGMDCCFEPGDVRHAGEHYGKPPKQILDVRVNGRWFRTSAALIYAAKNFINTLNDMAALRPGEFEFFFYGDGMLENMLVASQASLEKSTQKEIANA